MWKELDGADPDPVWPGSVAVRRYEPGGAEAVKRLVDEAYLAWDQGYIPMAHDDWVGCMTKDSDFDPTVWWLAGAGGAPSAAHCSGVGAG